MKDKMSEIAFLHIAKLNWRVYKLVLKTKYWSYVKPVTLKHRDNCMDEVLLFMTWHSHQQRMIHVRWHTRIAYVWLTCSHYHDKPGPTTGPAAAEIARVGGHYASDSCSMLDYVCVYVINFLLLLLIIMIKSYSPISIASQYATSY